MAKAMVRIAGRDGNGAAYYNSIAKGYDRLHRKEQLRKLAVISRFIPAGALILDVGCGTGLSAILGRVVGVDPSREMLLHAEMPVAQGVGEQLPFKDGSADVVICATALHNFSDFKAGMREMARVSRGRIIISLLKKARGFAAMEKRIRGAFIVQDVAEDAIDRIFVCGKRA